MARDIVDLLLDDHQDFRDLFDELERTDPGGRDELFRYLVARLASHEAAEAAVVHRVVRDDVPGGEEVAKARLAEEDEAERLLADMDRMDADSDEFAEALRSLKQDVLAHAEHEEHEEFPMVREHLDAERREELGDLFQTLRDAGPTRPHPHTPQTPGVRAAVGPFVGFFDRARDAVRDTFADK